MECGRSRTVIVFRYLSAIPHCDFPVVCFSYLLSIIKNMVYRKACNRIVLLSALLASGTGSLIAQCDTSGFWHTSGNKILDQNGQTVRISGVNWYGFETIDYIAHGLWAQDYESILNTVKSQGYNTIRVPFSNQMVEQNPVPSNFTTSGGKNSDLQNLHSLDILDKIIGYSKQIGLRIILDNHRSEAGNSAEDNGLWYTSAYPESQWQADWVKLATKYACNSTVVGYDLRNEPHNNASWGSGDPSTDWRLAAQNAGNKIQAVSPNALIFVEGIQAYNNDYDWWGGNLEGAGQYPVTLGVANRVVYSAHDYGPNLSGQPWFNGSTTYNSLVQTFTQKWAYLSLQGIAPVWVGEFGTTNNASDLQNNAAGSQGQWFQSLVQFLGQNPNISWTYWALNGEDNYGLLNSNYDSTPASATKQQMLASIQSASGGGSTTPNFTVSATTGSQTVTAGGTAQYGISVAAQNGFTGPVSFSVSGVPANATGTFSPASITTSGSTTLTVVTGSGTATGNYTLTVNAMSGSLTRSTTVALIVNSVPVPDFSITANPSSATLTAGSGAQVSITTAATNGFNGTVTLSASGLPAGVTASFAPASVNGSGASSLTLVSSASTTAGTYPIAVKGTSGSLSHTTTVTLIVQSAQSGGGGCLVTWQVYSDWGQGFVTGITVTNKGSSAINGWTLAWTFTGNQQITNLWNGMLSQSGQSIRVANASYNTTITAGGNQMLGFQAAYSGTNQRPATFTLNGQTCASN